MNEEELRKTYEEALERKDAEIARLKEENELLLRLSVKGSEEKERLKERLSRVERHTQSFK